MSGLRYADSASVRALVLAAKTLTQRGGSLTLLNPRQPVARTLTLMGADQIFTIRRAIQGEPEAGDPAS
jgi:anti-anti-sigma factor